jgi:hypothetical protein
MPHTPRHCPHHVHPFTSHPRPPLLLPLPSLSHNTRTLSFARFTRKGHSGSEKPAFAAAPLEVCLIAGATYHQRLDPGCPQQQQSTYLMHSSPRSAGKVGGKLKSAGAKLSAKRKAAAQDPVHEGDAALSGDLVGSRHLDSTCRGPGGLSRCSLAGSGLPMGGGTARGFFVRLKLLRVGLHGEA